MSFIRNSCEELRFDPGKMDESVTKKYTESSLKAGQIPYNMQMDIQYGTYRESTDGDGHRYGGAGLAFMKN